MLGAVFRDIFEAETRWQVEIELHGGELPGAANGVDELDVDFGTIERGFAGDGFIGDVELLHRLGERGGGTVPVFGLAGVIFWMRGVPIGEFDFEFVEAKIFHYGEGEIDAGFDFGFNLRRCAENVRVILREAANAEQAVEDAAAFVAIDGAEFGQTNGQIAVTVKL